MTFPVRTAAWLAAPTAWRLRLAAWFSRAESQVAVQLAVYVLLWTWVGIASRSNFDAPGDMVEAYAWAQGWQWGYWKHPPLAAWIAGIWFAVVPESHAGYSLLTALNGAVGLAGLAVLAGEFVPRRWVVLVVAVASLAPGLTTLAMRFNANAILVSTWPWATALFVRLMQRGRMGDAVGCGLACALAVLGKYYSAVLLASFVVCALWLPAWRARLATAPVALAWLCFSIAMAPHLAWLSAQTEGPLHYAQAATGHHGAGHAALRALHFALVQCVFPLLALAALRVALAGPVRNRAFLRAATAPLRPSGDALWLLAMLPVLGTMLATVLTSARTAWVWGLPIAAGLALLAVSRARSAGAVIDTARLWKTLAVIWLAVALLAPLWWIARASAGTPGVSEPRAELAQAAERVWAREVGGRLPWVGGTRALAASVSFYAPTHPRYWSIWNGTVETPWVDLDRVQAQGGLIVCALDDEPCRDQAARWTAESQRVVAAKVERGFRFQPVAYDLFLVRPWRAFAG